MADIRLDCTVESNALATSKDKGTPSVKLSLAYFNDLGVKQYIYADMWLSEAAVDRSLKTLLEVFNFSGKLSELNEPILAGLPCSAVCEWETYDDKQRLKVKFINRQGKAMAKADPQIAKDLDARFAAAIANNAAKARAEGIKFEAATTEEQAAHNPAGPRNDAPPPTDADVPSWD